MLCEGRLLSMTFCDLEELDPASLARLSTVLMWLPRASATHARSSTRHASTHSKQLLNRQAYGRRSASGVVHFSLQSLRPRAHPAELHL
ncbi:uncharacterized protein AKAME5_002110100 [Lates japonicus]|uniref:Uncharacterized protein n=1 Tax=Lates japonicus TaxID=270547 RepID=A0AAD3NEJ9_LATJO|nr:uncharacterized protein AKAME5_002110100 [Lates japonicus]